MTAQAAVETALPAVAPEPVSAASFALGRLTLIAFAAFVALFACWHVAQTAPYRSGTGIGYALGLVGGSLMLILLLYPLRKRMHFMQHWGPLKYWFRLHMVGGILGPALVVFHSTFRVGSLNAAVALVSMLLVVASGLVGRFLYRKIHRGLYGSELTLKELQQALQADLAAVEPLLAPLPAVADDLRAFVAMVAAPPANWRQRTTHFLLLDWRRWQVRRRIRRHLGPAANAAASLQRLLARIDDTLRVAQQAAQFSTYERLFSLWHVVHIPFLCMLVITAVIHVAAVHLY